jgi:hypothetical protein
LAIVRIPLLRPENPPGIPRNSVMNHPNRRHGEVPPAPPELEEELDELLLELLLLEVDDSSVSALVLGGGIIQRVRAYWTGRWLVARFCRTVTVTLVRPVLASSSLYSTE